ncbi:MAG: hypothetical protein AABZ74_18970 [Cyanobacteriota bacterium]
MNKINCIKKIDRGFFPENYIYFYNDSNLFFYSLDDDSILKFDFLEREFKIKLCYLGEDIIASKFFYSAKENIFIVLDSNIFYSINLKNNEIIKLLILDEKLSPDSYYINYIEEINCLIFQYKINKVLVFNLSTNTLSTLYDKINGEINSISYSNGYLLINTQISSFRSKIEVYLFDNLKLEDSFEFGDLIFDAFLLFEEKKILIEYTTPERQQNNGEICIYDMKNKSFFYFKAHEKLLLKLRPYNKGSFLTYGINLRDSIEMKIWDNNLECISSLEVDTKDFRIIFPKNNNFKRFITHYHSNIFSIWEFS